MSKSVNILTWSSCILILLFMAQCKTKSAHNEKDQVDFCDSLPTLIKAEDAFNHLHSKGLNIPISRENITCFEIRENSILGEFAIHDFVDNKILLQSGNSLFVYELPSGKFLQKLSKFGDGNGEYRNITAAVFAPDKSDIAVLESRWQDESSNVIVYDGNQKIVSRTRLPIIGNLIRFRPKNGFIAPNAVTAAGGNSKLYHLNDNFQIVDSIDCNKHYPERAVFNMSEYIDKLSRVPTMILRDTLFNVSSDFSLTPILYLDYNGKGVPENFSRKNYKTYDQYLKASAEMIFPTQLQALGDKLIARLEYHDKVYYAIWNAKTGELLYSRKAKESDWGMKLHIGEAVFNQWPIGEWDGKLIFYIPDYMMSEITENEDSNPGLGFVPTDHIDNILKHL